MSDLNLISVNERLEAVEAKRKAVEDEFNAVRAEVLEQCIKFCRTFHFTAKELQLQDASTSRRATGSTAKPKYQNPNGPETWSGRGSSKPQWFLDALAEGYSKEDLLIK